jgi:hypothetical protein
MLVNPAYGILVAFEIKIEGNCSLGYQDLAIDY